MSTQNIKMQRTNPKRNIKQSLKFADEQPILMGIGANGKKTKYHGWNDTYDREFDGLESIFNHTNRLDCYKIDDFVVEDNDNIAHNLMIDYGSGNYSDYSEEEFEDEDSSEEEEFEDEDSSEEEEFEDDSEEEF